MGLEYPGEWKFEGIGFGVPPSAVEEFFSLLLEIGGNSKEAVEEFKAAFGSSGSSSSLDWAITDLSGAMTGRASNAAAFVDSVWSSIESAKELALKVPSVKLINRILEKHAVPLVIDPPNLKALGGDAVIVAAAVGGGSASANLTPLFKLGDKVGSGGYGVVYKATRGTAVSEFEFALKLLDPSPFVDDYEKAVKRFQREVKAVQLLQHRAIVPYYEAGITLDNKPYLVMPYIDGVDLRSAAETLLLPDILRMFEEVTGALGYAHGLNVIHRDLKPRNIIVRKSDQQPIILDFGSAYLLDYLDSDSLTTNVVGTAGYIPIEVLSNPKARSPLQDIYACGVMLYECIAGHVPDPTDYDPLSDIDESYAPMDEVIRSAIAGAKKRTSSAKELMHQLQDVRASLEEA